MPGISELGTFNFRGHTLRVIVVGNKYEDENGKTIMKPGTLKATKRSAGSSTSTRSPRFR